MYKLQKPNVSRANCPPMKSRLSLILITHHAQAGRLIANGGSLLVIEHNMEVIRSSDWIIDLGPEGGSGGGRIVAEGTPDEIAAVKESYGAVFVGDEIRMQNRYTMASVMNFKVPAA